MTRKSTKTQDDWSISNIDQRYLKFQKKYLNFVPRWVCGWEKLEPLLHFWGRMWTWKKRKRKMMEKAKIKVLWDNKTMSRSWWDVLVKLFFTDHNLRVRSHKKCYHVFFKFHRSLNNFHRSVHFSHCFPRDRLVFSLIVLFIIIVTHGCSSCKDWCNRGVPGGSIFRSRLDRQF